MEKFENYTPKMAYDWLAYNRLLKHIQINDSERDYLERIIVTDVHYSYWYARFVLKKPFPLGESIFATNAKYSYWYARDVLKKPFPLGEPIIATDGWASYYYVSKVLKKPFLLGEPLIFSHSHYTKYYIDFLIETNQINESTMFDYDNLTRTFLGKFLDGKI